MRFLKHFLLLFVLFSLFWPLSSASAMDSVYWSLTPSSTVLYVAPGESADLVVTFLNYPCSSSFLIWESMGFGGYYDCYAGLSFKPPPAIEPGVSWTGSVATVHVYASTPYGSVCTCEGCTFDVAVRDGVPSSAFEHVTIVAARLFNVIVDVEPDSLSMRGSQRGWVTAYVSLPEELLACDVLARSVKLQIGELSFPMVWDSLQDGNVVVAKFDRGAVVDYLKNLLSGSNRVWWPFKIVGEMKDRTGFEGVDLVE